MTHDGNHNQSHPDNGLSLPGLDGSNPLGFLAALGILHALTRCRSGTVITLAWQLVNGVWHPLVAGGGRNVKEFLDQLESALRASDSAPWALDKKLPFEANRLREAASAALSAATHVKRERIDVLASFGVESLQDDKGAFRDTSLRMVRAGDNDGQGLLAYATRIRGETTRDNLCEALCDTWRYEDENCALRWDPSERRDHALRWGDPGKEKTRSVRGANRLAIEAMPVLPTMPLGQRVKTTGFEFPDGRTESLTWPIWRVPAGLDVVRSLLTLPDLQKKRPNALALRSRGVAAVYRCDRIKTSKYYSNFTPARRIA